MYRMARGVGPSRDVAGSASAARAHTASLDKPEFIETFSKDNQEKKRKMAMLMAGQAMQGMGQGMSQGLMMPTMPPPTALDLYGNPV